MEREEENVGLDMVRGGLWVMLRVNEGFDPRNGVVDGRN
jgi:hypothetical protein